MAISGAAGWVPSLRYSLDGQGRLVGIGITQNKPRECVYGDRVAGCAGSIADAAQLIAAGTACNVDVRYLQVVTLRRLVEEFTCATS